MEECLCHYSAVVERMVGAGAGAGVEVQTSFLCGTDSPLWCCVWMAVMSAAFSLVMAMTMEYCREEIVMSFCWLLFSFLLTARRGTLLWLLNNG